MSEMTTRQAVPDDFPRLCELWREQRDIEIQLDPRLVSIETEQSVEELLHEMQQPDHKVYIAIRDEEILGFIHVSCLAGHRGVVYNIVIDAHRGQGGVGTQLLNAAMDWFRKQDVRILSVRVPRHHAVQQAFWRGKGASVVQEVMVLNVKSDEEGHS